MWVNATRSTLKRFCMGSIMVCAHSLALMFLYNITKIKVTEKPTLCRKRTALLHDMMANITYVQMKDPALAKKHRIKNRESVP